MATAGVLDDFLDSIEGLSEEVRERLGAMAARDATLEEERRALFKKRCLYLRADEKGLDASLRASLLRKIEKEHAALVSVLNSRAEEAQKMAAALRAHLSRLDSEIAARGISLPSLSAMGFEDGGASEANPYASVFEAVAQPQTAQPSLAAPTESPSRRAPPRRGAGEPVYCHCRQGAYGDMVACDAPGCALEWFHYACVGLSSPPAGRWFCSVCTSRGRTFRRSSSTSTDSD